MMFCNITLTCLVCGLVNVIPDGRQRRRIVVMLIKILCRAETRNVEKMTMLDKESWLERWGSFLFLFAPYLFGFLIHPDFMTVHSKDLLLPAVVLVFLSPGSVYRFLLLPTACFSFGAFSFLAFGALPDPPDLLVRIRSSLPFAPWFLALSLAAYAALQSDFQHAFSRDSAPWRSCLATNALQLALIAAAAGGMQLIKQIL